MIILISSIPRLINAGCGEVLTAKVPYSGDTGATHLLTESRYMSGNQLDLASLYSGLCDKLPSYARPVFVRFVKELSATGRKRVTSCQYES